ncbi:C6 transcription factor [Cordyceps fumosorosea ARSEF 2679]|uniref:C6 transcription factor n=1 Tax=Cordyceps fumosorosea (strain ARSEF 2679) TaxID=1081104 RepID=A0A162J382_CORFA|nr:C6 transcription factor [Cordyceps fumosorosea ARSEF 2679]OAA63152.1 C6 transcription factor [Cordyceps fumosorosea ARSEF 2679]
MSPLPSESKTEPAYQVISFQPHREAQARKYITRKSHRKSRGGCLGCKLSRIKCDEGKPSCTRCLRCNAECQYSASGRSKPARKPAPSKRGDAIGATTALTPYTPPFAFAQPSAIALANTYLQSKSPARGVSRVSLLHHINQHFHAPSTGLETACGQMAFIVGLGASRPYLLDVTLAVAACHLRHMYQTNNDDDAAVSACRVAEHYQQSLAIRSFNRALGEPLDQEASDSVLISSMMFNLLSFALDDDDDPARSWVFTAAPDRLAWFSLSMGLAPLLERTKRFHDRSILRHIFDASDDERKTYHGDGAKSLSRVPPHWLRLCGLDYASADPDHIFYEPVRVLAELVSTPVSHESFFLYMAFFGKVGVAFRSLLEHDSEPAMWLLGYWLGLLCRFDQVWWLSGRARRDYRAICIWLDKRKVRRRPEAEGLMWRQLMVDLEGATQQAVEVKVKGFKRPEPTEILA